MLRHSGRVLRSDTSHSFLGFLAFQVAAVVLSLSVSTFDAAIERVASGGLSVATI